MSARDDFDTPRQRNPRLGVLALLIGLSLLYLLGGMAWHQLWLHGDYLRQERRQNHRAVVLPGPRGQLYDREGRLLAGNRARHSAVVYLNELRPEFRAEYRARLRAARAAGPVESTAGLAVEARRAVVQRYLDQVCALIGRTVELRGRDFERHFQRNLLLPFPLVEDLADAEFARLAEAVPPNAPVQITTDSVRYYPHGALAAHTLGYVASTEVEGAPAEAEEARLRVFRPRTWRGAAGVEEHFDARLRAQPGHEVWVVDPAGFQYERLSHERPVPGGDVVLSLDLNLQAAAERALAPRTGAAVLLDVASGEVLALASAPGYDLNGFAGGASAEFVRDLDARGAWLHRAVQGVYPPGSTFKIVTAVAALRAGATPADVHYCGGFVNVGGRRFHCNNREGHGPMDLREALAYSCNVWFYEQALKIGPEAVAAAARQFHLDEPTGLEWPHESARMRVPGPDTRRAEGAAWFGGDTANLAIGQGELLQSPLQMAAFAASVARREDRTAVTLCRRLPGEPADHRARSVELPPGAWDAIGDGLRRAAEYGTAKFLRVPGLRVAAKTGTAQIRLDGQPGTLAWTIGYAPAEAPRVAFAVLIEGSAPGDSTAGGIDAAPVAAAMLDAWVRHGPP